MNLTDRQNQDISCQESETLTSAVFALVPLTCTDIRYTQVPSTMKWCKRETAVLSGGHRNNLDELRFQSQTTSSPVTYKPACRVTSGCDLYTFNKCDPNEQAAEERERQGLAVCSTFSFCSFTMKDSEHIQSPPSAPSTLSPPPPQLKSFISSLSLYC